MIITKDHQTIRNENLATEKLLNYMDRDYELRKLALEQSQQDLKQKKWKTRAFVAVFGLPLVFWLFVIGNTAMNSTFIGDYVALVSINGVIGPDQPASANKLVPVIKKAFKDDQAKGIVLLINSPGGTPVQSDIIYNAIKRLRLQYPEKQVIAIGEDMLTSGAYWVASSAESIYVNRSTITGSIGVIASSFGFDLEKFATHYGLERRVQASGSYKNRNDMFLPQQEDDVKKTDAVLMSLHKNFEHAVLTGRSDRIRVELDQLFSGDYWTGDKALEMGIVDHIGDLSAVLEEEFGVDSVKDYTPIKNFYDNIKQSFSAQVFFNSIGRMFIDTDHVTYWAK